MAQSPPTLPIAASAWIPNMSPTGSETEPAARKVALSGSVTMPRSSSSLPFGPETAGRTKSTF